MGNIGRVLGFVGCIGLLLAMPRLAHAEDLVIDAHGEAITVPLLDGFELLSEGMRAKMGLVDPPGSNNRTVAIFVARGLLEKLEAGNPPARMRYLDVQVPRKHVWQTGTRAAFREAIAMVKKGGLDGIANKEFAEQGRAGALGGVSNLLHEGERYFVLHMHHTGNGQREDVGAATVLVRARMIHLYVRSMPGDVEEGAWASDTAKNWGRGARGRQLTNARLAQGRSQKRRRFLG
ncbi:MAG: hypothetical protein IPL79_00865 [Myxococcales bacterium]|nr:hypothetical protein [Myxococcales bacterium]